MKNLLLLALILPAALILQLAFFPGFVPPLLRPDVGILLAMLTLAFAERETGLIAVFLFGVQSDLFCSQRFGLLTLCYLLAAGVVLLAGWRELSRGNFFAACVAATAGTFTAHATYCVIAKLMGLDVGSGHAVANLLSLVLAAAVWSLPAAYLLGKLMFKLRVMSPAVQQRWSAEERLSSSRRRAHV